MRAPRSISSGSSLTTLSSLPSSSRNRACPLKRADQGTRLPLREQVAPVEGQGRRRDHRIPVVARLLHAGLLDDRVADLRAGVVDAVHDHRPAVVLALLDDVQLVTAARAVLHFPQPAVGRERQPLRRPVAHGPRARQAQRRIAGRRLAFGRDVNHLAQIGIQVLRLQRERIAGGAIANRRRTDSRPSDRSAMREPDLLHRAIGERGRLEDGGDVRDRASVLVQVALSTAWAQVSASMIRR